MCRAKTFGSFGYIQHMYGVSSAVSEDGGDDDVEKPRTPSAEDEAKLPPVPRAKSWKGTSAMMADPASPLRRGHSDLRLDQLKAWSEHNGLPQLKSQLADCNAKTALEEESACDLMFDFDALEDASPLKPTPQAQTLPIGFGFNSLDVLHTTPKASSGEAPSAIPVPEEMEDEACAQPQASSGSTAQTHCSSVPPGTLFDFDLMDEEASTSASDSPVEEVAAALPNAGLQEETFLRSVSAPAATLRHSKLVRLAIVACGSTGDLVPLVALARELIPRGYLVRMLTNANLVGFCTEHGVDTLPVFADSMATIQRSGGMSGQSIEANIHAIRHAEEWLREHPNACVAVDDALEEFAPDIMLATYMGHGACLRYEAAHCVPVVFALPQIHDADQFEGVIPTEPQRPTFIPYDTDLSQKPIPRIFDRLHCEYTKSWMLPEDLTPVELARLTPLRKWMEQGKPPIAVGWGSMLMAGMKPVEMLGLAISTLKSLQRRGVILGGWAGLEETWQELLDGPLSQENERVLGTNAKELINYARTEIYVISEAPHHWLLPQCTCFVSHGGAGSVQAAMRAGCPIVVTPIFGDQFMQSEGVQSLGIGKGFSQDLHAISTMQLKIGVQKAEACKFKCELLKSRLLAEEKLSSNGREKAAAAFDKFFSREVETGRWRRRAADFYCKKKVSARQAAALKKAEADRMPAGLTRYL